MSAIKRVTVEVNPARYPFQDNETLWTYAQRSLREFGVQGGVVEVCGRVPGIDISTYDQPNTLIAGREVVTIECTIPLPQKVCG